MKRRLFSIAVLLGILGGYVWSQSAPSPPAGLTTTFDGAKPLKITTVFPTGRVGVPYSVQLTATGGTPPYHWSMLAGSLPPGLQLTDNGVIVGAPLVAGKFGPIEIKP
jgi:hypothetical protein